MRSQITNPYLPSFEYVPDGEPHVFGERIYVYGSHDRFDGADFCLNDYICYSAPVTDLTAWRYEGIIFRKLLDPRNQNIAPDAKPFGPGFGAKAAYEPRDLNEPGVHAMFAPDVCKGPDGRYYLYYCLDFLPEIGVAVCDTPAGEYVFYGFVQHADGTPLGAKAGDPFQFDPGVFLDDDGQVYLYSGNAPIYLGWCGEGHYSQVMRLENDMLTLREPPRRLMPDLRNSAGTGYEGHEFFEASSIRKINGKYYFVYSSVRSHELCYAVSAKPDEGYAYGGTLVDIGDVFRKGRTADEAVNALGNTHGGIECVNGQWYVFYHRQTNTTQYSRQACAEKIFFRPDGSIGQAEVTSLGMNAAPLDGKGTYGAYIACHLTRNGKNVESLPTVMKGAYPYFTQDEKDFDPTPETVLADRESPVQYIANIQDGTKIGFKYFAFADSRLTEICVRGKAEGTLEVEGCGRLSIAIDTAEWTSLPMDLPLPDGVHPLYLCYHGKGALQFHTFTFA